MHNKSFRAYEKRTLGHCGNVQLLTKAPPLQLPAPWAQPRADRTHQAPHLRQVTSSPTLRYYIYCILALYPFSGKCTHNQVRLRTYFQDRLALLLRYKIKIPRSRVPHYSPTLSFYPPLTTICFTNPTDIQYIQNCTLA